jgi:ketosteroid isomerase-like protein
VTALSVAHALIEALDRNDAEAMRPLFARDAYWWVDTGYDRASGRLDMDPGEGRPWPLHGRMDAQAKCDSLRGVRDRFPRGVRQHIRRSFADDATAVLEVEGEGVFLDGSVYANRYAFAIEVVNEQVTAVREYLDTAHSADVFTGRHLDRRSADLGPRRRAAIARTPAQEAAVAFLRAITESDGHALLALCTDTATWWADTGTRRGDGPEADVLIAPELVVVGKVLVTARAPRIDNLRHQFPSGLDVWPVAFIEAPTQRSTGPTHLVGVEACGDGVRLNGRRYQNRYMFVLGVDSDHRITEVREYCDTLHAFDVYELDM